MSRSRKRDAFAEKREPPVVHGRVPPASLDAEECVLSACMLDRAALDSVLPLLAAIHFYSEANGRIYEAIQAIAEEGKPVDVVTVAAHLRSKGQLAQVGGPSYLAQISDSTPAVAHVEHHAREVREKWRLRSLIATCQRTAAEGYGDVGQIQAFVESHEAAVYELARPEGGSAADSQPLGTVIREEFARLQQNTERGITMMGRPTKFERLDEKTAGQHDGDLTVVAARPGMGKTSFVLNLGVNMASPTSREVAREDGYGTEWLTDPGVGVLVFSLEMPREQLATRMVCSEARVDIGKMRQGMLQPEDWRRMTEAASILVELPVLLDDTPAITLVGIRAKTRQARRTFEKSGVRLGLVVVDYLQLVAGREDAPSREQEISETSRGLKALAKELKVPVIALSQLNRSVETRNTKDKRPQMSDLRESGAIEQDADTIIFIYRDEYYHADTTEHRGIAELIIAKQRNGPTGKVFVKFTGSYARFDNLDFHEYPTSANDDE